MQYQYQSVKFILPIYRWYISHHGRYLENISSIGSNGRNLKENKRKKKKGEKQRGGCVLMAWSCRKNEMKEKKTKNCCRILEGDRKREMRRVPSRHCSAAMHQWGVHHLRRLCCPAPSPPFLSLPSLSSTLRLQQKEGTEALSLGFFFSIFFSVCQASSMFEQQRNFFLSRMSWFDPSRVSSMVEPTY